MKGSISNKNAFLIFALLLVLGAFYVMALRYWSEDINRKTIHDIPYTGYAVIPSYLPIPVILGKLLIKNQKILGNIIFKYRRVGREEGATHIF